MPRVILKMEENDFKDWRDKVGGEDDMVKRLELMEPLKDYTVEKAEADVKVEDYKDRYEQASKEVDDLRGELKNAKEEHESFRKLYRERFFNTPEGAIKDQDKDVREDDVSTKVTFDDLFKEREV